MPTCKALNGLEMVTKWGRRDTQQIDDGRGKAETRHAEKFSVGRYVLVRSIKGSFCLHSFPLVTTIINPKGN